MAIDKSSSEYQVFESMYANDDFSQWLGIELLEVQTGACRLKMTVRKEMTNGFDIAHGGITYSFADSAFAFASNGRGRKAVSIETSISHVAKVEIGDTLFAKAEEMNLSHKLAVYEVTVTNQREEKVALFKGTVYRTSKEWFSKKDI